MFGSRLGRKSLDEDERRDRSGSHEELLEEVLGKQVLQVVIDAFALVRRARLAYTQNRQTEVLDLDTRLRSCPSRVLAAFHVPLDIRASVIMMVP